MLEEDNQNSEDEHGGITQYGEELLSLTTYIT